MRSFALTLLLLSCAPAEPQVAARTDGILGGAADTSSTDVFLLDLRFDNGASICTAVLVSPQVLLTAAHCVDPAFRGASTVTVRATNRANIAGLMQSDMIDVTVITRHPMWNPTDPASDFDLAGLKLATASSVSPLPLLRALPANPLGQSLRVVGYGRTSVNDAASSGTRRTVTVPITGTTPATLEYGTDGVAGICAGDSGGPSFLGGALAGVHSRSEGANCGVGVDMRVDSHLGFIDGFVAANDPPSCSGDGRCATGCATTDPDCPTCLANGQCEAGCASDPDCVCVANGRCEAGCGLTDADCLDDGAVCTAASECAGAQCLDDPRGFKFCSRTCAATADCQNDMTCQAGVCRAPPGDQVIKGGCSSAPGLMVGLLLLLLRRRRAWTLLVFLALPGAAWAVGEGANGFPNWAERVEHEWMNRARCDPQVEMQRCGAPCIEGACYAPTPPLTWGRQLSHAARFHSDELSKQGYFAHDSACTLVSNIDALYPASCDGSAACGCVGGVKSCSGGCTTWSARVGLFGGSPAGEIIASPSDPDSAFYLWLYEGSSTSACGYNSANGHRYNILQSGPSVGVGVGSGPSVGDFGGPGEALAKIPSGAHYPQQAASVEVWANWYDTAAPMRALVDVDGACTPMTRQRGSDTNGAWSATVTGVGSGCHRYFFSFVDSTGAAVTYPTTGSLGIGSTESCLAWDPARPAAGAGCACTPTCGGKTCGDDGCGGSCGTCSGGATCQASQCVGAPDAGGPDAGASTGGDAGASTGGDAGASIDGDAGTPARGDGQVTGGCGCAAGTGLRSGVWMFGLALFALTSSRRRGRSR